MLKQFFQVANESKIEKEKLISVEINKLESQKLRLQTELEKLKVALQQTVSQEEHDSIVLGLKNELEKIMLLNLELSKGFIY